MARPDTYRNALRRRFVTPEGVDLNIELSSAGARAGAFLLDLIFMVIAMVVMTFVILALGIASQSILLAGLWLVGFFILRNGWFALFEMGGRGATPGKRIVGLRVVARDGARLTGGAVIARNAMREIEFFLPFSFFWGSVGAMVTEADLILPFVALGWSLVFLLFPLFNRDKLRVGDMIAGTWVVVRVKAELGHDLVAWAAESQRMRHSFTDAQLDLYGEYELQTLEQVLRAGQNDAVYTVAAAIRRKGGIDDHGDDYGFLSDYYAALCNRLERGMMVGIRREDKFSQASRNKAA